MGVGEQGPIRQLTTVSRELHDTPSVTKAVSRLFFTTAISTAKCSALPTE